MSSSNIHSRRSLRPNRLKKQTARAAEAEAMGNYESMDSPMPRRVSVSRSRSSTTTSSSMNNTDMKKPMRPLTAYHIFFQIEREYIIQTTPGSDADKSIHNNKSYLTDVPRKYRKVKLLPDWYAGPGKRQKRKHRKSHGKIGFLELSRVISKRWAILDTSDPETKQYVHMIAARELDDYKVEMNEWKELYGEEIEEKEEKVAPAPKKQRAKRSVGRPKKSSVSISPSSSPGASPRPYDAAMLRQLYHHQPAPAMPQLVVLTAAAAASTEEVAQQQQQQLIDYTICKVSNNGHYLPSPTEGIHYESSDDSSGIDEYDPLFELDKEDPLLKAVRSVSPGSAAV